MEWQRTEPTKVTKVGWRTITSKTFVMPDGRTEVFDTVGADGECGVAVIAITIDKKVIVVKQYRPGPETVKWDIPGGGVDTKDEGDHEVAAIRELAEETGYTPGQIEYVGKDNNKAYQNITHYYYLAQNCVSKEGLMAHELNEFIEVELLSIDDFIKKAKDGLVGDTAAVLYAYDRLIQIRDSKE